jgi:beta-lactam-binding protein with PASTA domain
LPGNSVAMVYVPDVTGAWHEDAVATLEGLCEPYPCFAVSLVEEPFDAEGLESGYVLEQSPYLENAAVGSEVVLTVVADPTEDDAIEVPEVVGLTVGEAQTALENACEPVPCFGVTFEYVSDDPEGYGPGYVSDQTLLGEFAIPGSEVQLTVIDVAAGETIVIPDVTELSVDEARQSLEESCAEPPCLVVEEIVVADEGWEPGVVFDQDPLADSEVPRDSTVTLYVGG